MRKTISPEPWFDDIILDGLTQLFSLNLEGTPASELAPITASTWSKSLWAQSINWCETLDAWRLERGFILTMGRVNRFPSPNSVLLSMPPRPELKKIEGNKISEKERSDNAKKLRSLIKNAMTGKIAA